MVANGTDLKKTGIGEITGKIVLVQPAKLLGKVFPHEEIFEDVSNFRAMTHIGTLRYGSYFDSNPFYGIKKCGGELKITPMEQTPPWFQNALKGDDITPITCSNPDCGLYLRIYCPPSELRSVMFSLMFKQMFPGWNSFHYLDCGSYQWEQYYPYFSKEERMAITRLGLISLIPFCFWGNVKSEVGHVGHYDLGFTLYAGVNSLDSFDGLDTWARFLVGKKEEQLKNFLDHEAYPSLLGPRMPFHRHK